MSQHATSLTDDSDFPNFAARAPIAAAVIRKDSHGNMSVLRAAFEEYERWLYLVTN